MKNVKRLFTTFILFSIITACNIFGFDITGIWIVSGAGDAKMQLQQSGSQVVGYAYYQGQYEGQVVGVLSGSNVTLQIRKTYAVPLTYTGTISSDGNSMQLRANTGQTLTMFKS